MPIGAILGGFFSGKIADRFGRRKTLMFADVIVIIFGVFTCIPYTACFAIGRFITGISVGIFGSISPIYMSEICPSNIRGKVGSLTCLQISFGIVTAYCLSFILPTQNLKNDPDNNL